MVSISSFSCSVRAQDMSERNAKTILSSLKQMTCNEISFKCWDVIIVVHEFLKYVRLYNYVISLKQEYDRSNDKI